MRPGILSLCCRHPSCSASEQAEEVLRQGGQGRRQVELLRACLAAAQGHSPTAAERVLPATRHGIPAAVQYAIEIQRDHGPSAPRRKVSLEMHGPSADTALSL